MDGYPVFLSCRSCGRYFPESETSSKRYCSRECSSIFGRCITCGRYFAIVGEGAVEHCSSECAAVYPVRLENRIIHILEEEP